MDRRVGQGTYASLPYVPSALVVDDEQRLCESVVRFLNHCGWAGASVNSGEGALQQLEGQHFDLILLDLVMPGISGAETFREIRKADPNVPVVIVTAYPDSDLMAQALQVGPFAVIKKPFTLSELSEVLRGLPRAPEAATGISRIEGTSATTRRGQD